MEISQIKYFMAIVEHGTFRKAAERLFISQPALTKSVKKLEDELGTPLFERKGVHIELTQAGKIFVPYCGNILNMLDGGTKAVREAVGLKYGHISIAVSAEIFIKNLIFDFLQKNQDVSISCQLMSVDEMVHGLEQGSLDFVISERPVTGELIEWRELISVGLTALVNKDDPLSKRKEISVEELKDNYFCIGHTRSNITSHVFSLCREAGFEPKIRYIGYDPDMSGMLLNMPGSVIVSSEIIDKSIVKTDIGGENNSKPIQIKGTKGKALVGIAQKPIHYRSEAADRFMDEIIKYYSNL